MQRFVRVDGKVRTDTTYPAGLMDVIDIAQTDEHFRLVYDAKGRFETHRITKVPPDGHVGPYHQGQLHLHVWNARRCSQVWLAH